MPPTIGTQMRILISLLVLLVLLTQVDSLFSTKWIVDPYLEGTTLTTTIKTEITDPPSTPGALSIIPLIDIAIQYKCDAMANFSPLPSDGVIFNIPGSTTSFSCDFKSDNVRIPMKLDFNTGVTGVGSLYTFPGISPITTKIEPLLQFRADSQGSLVTARIIAHNEDFPASFLSNLYFFYIPAQTTTPGLKRYTDPSKHDSNVDVMSLHAWKIGMPHNTDHDAYPSATSIYPFFYPERRPNMIPWAKSNGIYNDDITSLVKLEQGEQGVHKLTIRYDLASAPRANPANAHSLDQTLSGSFSGYTMEVTLPKTDIYKFFDPSYSCKYGSHTINPSSDNTDDLDASELDGRDGNKVFEKYFTWFECEFTILGTSLSILRSNAAFFALTVPSISNQFVLLLTLTPYNGYGDKSPQLVVLGNSLTQTNWSNLISGQIETIPISDPVENEIKFPADPNSNSGGVDTGTVTVRQFGLLSSLRVNPVGYTVTYKQIHEFGDGINPIGNPQFKYQALGNDRWGTCSSSTSFPGQHSAVSFSGEDTGLITVDIDDTTLSSPITSIIIVCTLYRYVSEENLFLKPSAIHGTKYVPAVTVIIDGFPHVSPSDQIYPTFIPTPRPLLTSSNPGDLSQSNTGLPVANWNNPVDVILRASINTDSSHIDFSQSLLDNQAYLYQNIPKSLSQDTFRFQVKYLDCGGDDAFVISPAPSKVSDFSIQLPELRPTMLKKITEKLGSCTMQISISLAIDGNESESTSFKQIFPVWEAPNGQTNDPFLKFTVNSSPTVYDFPFTSLPSDPNPPTLFISPQSVIRVHICLSHVITSLSLSATAAGDVFPSGFYSDQIDGLYSDCVDGFILNSVSTMFPSLDLLGHFLNFSVTIPSPTNKSVYSNKFLIQLPPSTLLTNVSVNGLSLVPYQPNSGPIVQLIDYTSSKISIGFNISPQVPSGSFKNLQISFQIPSWVSINPTTTQCTGNLGSQSTPTILSRSTSNPDITTSILTLPNFWSLTVPSRLDCDIKFSSPTTVVLPINPSLQIPITPIIISSQDNSGQLYTGTLPRSDLIFLHRSSSLFCPTQSNPYAPCRYQDQPIATPPVTPTAPPPTTTKLPVTTHSLSGFCDLVLTNRDTVVIYDDTKHKSICSIPIAGMLTSRKVTRDQYPDIFTQSSTQFPQTQTEFTLCDCKCKGYWYDDVLNLDQKKCSKCSIPQCPELLTPNTDCTACECVTEQCKRFRTYIFSTIYLKPEVLQYIIDVDTQNNSPTPTTVEYSSQNNLNLSNILYSPQQSIKSLYINTMASFSTHLTTYIQDQIDLISDTTNSSILESITISPLVEGSFTVWKITLSIINNSQQQLSTLEPLYGLPPIEDTIGKLFSDYYTTANGISSTDIPPQLELHITSPTLSDSNLKFFTSDIIKVGCLTRDGAKALGSSTPATADMLHRCPLPNQYTIISNDAKKTDLLNPLWSSCSSSSSSSSTPSSPRSQFIEYESLLDPTPKSKINLNVREIYPRCLDFTGIDVGLLHVTCAIDKSNLLYSSASSTLLLSTYTQSLLSSFTTSTLESVVATRIEDLKSIPLPKFPSFPQLTVAPCPDIDSSSSAASIKQCLTGYYGPDCSLQNTNKPTSMLTSPTNLSTQSHSHIQWEYLGDTTQELTLVLQSSHKNNGQGYFAWSQLLGTVPVASLYASAQIPTIEQSKLFQYIYDAIANDNDAFTAVYNAGTEVIIRGYFTRGADRGIGLDPDQIIEKFTFQLPMSCNDFQVQCRHSTSQFCHQSDGRCRCRPGYEDANPGKTRSQNYIVEPVDGSTDNSTVNIDGDDLQCVSICQNNSIWNEETNSCSCIDGTSGENCEVIDTCESNREQLCSNIKNGFVPVITIETEEEEVCSETCKCYGQWTSPFVPPPSTENPTPLPTQLCGFCPLKPLSSQLYTETTISELNTIITNYKNDPILAPYSTIDEKYSQTYQPQFIESEPLTQQRCYITGTDPVSYEPGNCSKCICQRGYGGDYCQLHVAYANITYTPGPNNKYTYDSMTEVLLFDKIAEELSLSMSNFDKSQLFVVQHDTDDHWIEIGFSTGLDFFTRNQELLNDQATSQSIIDILQINFNTGIEPPSGYNPQLPTNLDNLYTQWGQLQQNLPNTPITNQDSSEFLGDISAKEPLQDPVCFDQGLLGCSGEALSARPSSKTLLIGLVVGLVGAALLLAILIGSLLWCKSNKRGFWKSKEDQDRDEMSNFVPTTRKEFTGSTNAPSMTVGTLSIMPVVAAGGVEMTKTGASSAAPPSVQSVNNHAEVKDPTLPAGYKAYKDIKGNVFYINNDTMTTSWTHPNEVVPSDKADASNGYGSDW